MSTLTDFLIHHQVSLGSYYTPVMTLFMFAVISPVWSVYLLLCTFIGILPKNEYPILVTPCLIIRLVSDAILNPFALIIYTSLIPWLFDNNDILFYFFYKNSLSELSILPLSYFVCSVLFYLLWYRGNQILYKRIKPRFDFQSEYLITFYSPSRLFGAGAVMIALFDFDAQISFLLWNTVYLGALISVVRYCHTLYYAYSTSSYMLTNR